MTALPEMHDLVLVAYIKHPRNLEIARVLGWYHIPLRTAPKLIAVDWVAFYQPAAFGEQHRWQIEYVAPVRGHELLTRSELFKDEPDHQHAHEEYYKLQLGPVVLLPRLVPAGEWKRLNFLYTTGGRLLSADTIGDLTVRDDERVILWQTLRERAVEQNNVYAAQMSAAEIPHEILKLFFLSDGGTPKLDF